MILGHKRSALAFCGDAPNTKVSFGPAVVLAYFMVSSAFGIVLNGTLISDILVAPLYFVIPSGLGLFVLHLSGLGANCFYLNRAQLVVFSFLFGAVLLTLLFAIREYYGWWQIPAKIIYWSIAGLSMLGFLKSGKIFEWNERIRAHGLIFISAIPIVAVTYGITYYLFSDYPLTDIFQECHFMKGAMEFSRFDILNRSTADSYIPIIQVLNGLLNLVYGYNLLRAQWIFPVWAAIFSLICIYTAAAALVPDRSARWVAYLLAAALLAGLHLTNGNMARYGSLVLLSVLVNFDRKDPEWAKASVLPMLMILAVFLGQKLIKIEPLYLVLTILCVPASLYVAGRIAPANRVPLFAAIFVIILGSVHRSSIVFVPAVAVVFVMRFLAAHLPQLKEDDQKRLAFVCAVPVPLAVTAAFGLLVIVRSLADQTVLGSLVFTDFYDLIVKTLIQQDMHTGGEVALGAGAKLAALELGRQITPFLTGLLGVGFCFYWWLQFQQLRLRRSGAAVTPGSPLDRELLTEMLWLWPAFAILTLVILTGIPFAYRLGFLPALLGLVIVARFLRYFFLRYAGGGGAGAKKPLVVAAAAVMGYILVSSAVVYRSAVFGGSLNHDYLAWFLPVALSLYAAAVILFLLICVGQYSSRTATVLTVVLITTALYTDRQVIRTNFMDFSYGKETPPHATAITHYTKAEIELAHRLRSLPRNTVLVSDPYTVSILRAVTGLNAPFNYSNLDTMNPSYRLLLKTTLNRILRNEEHSSHIPSFCMKLMNMLNLGSTELNYAYHHTLARAGFQSMAALSAAITSDGNTARQPAGDSREFDDQSWIKQALFDKDAEPWTIAVVIGEKTLAWADPATDEKVGYFPMDAALDPLLIDHLEEYHEIIFNINDRVVAIRINCQN